jgi:hypothetical protein
MAGRAEKNSRWNRGRLISSQGYVLIRVGKCHPLADPRGYAYEHLLVWVAAGRKRPRRGFLIHHRDENKRHNWLGNLKRQPLSKHSRDHAQRQRCGRNGQFASRRSIKRGKR